MSGPFHEAEQIIAIALSEAPYRRSTILGTPHLFIDLTKLDGVTATASPAHRLCYNWTRQVAPDVNSAEQKWKERASE